MPFTQKPGNTGGRSESDGEGQNTEKEINPCIKERALCMPPIKGERQNLQPENITPGWPGASEGEGKNSDKEINTDKKINPCIKKSFMHATLYKEIGYCLNQNTEYCLNQNTERCLISFCVPLINIIVTLSGAKGLCVKRYSSLRSE